MDGGNYAYQYFLKKGWAPHQAAALAGNAVAESGKSVNPTLAHDKVNGVHTGLGIFGFRDPKPGVGRKTDLINYAKERGLDPMNRDTQLEFSDHELWQGKERANGQRLWGAKDLNSAQNAVVGYLRPQGYTAANPQGAHRYDYRLQQAQNILGSRLPAPTGYAGNTAGNDTPRDRGNLPAVQPTQVAGYSGLGGQDSPREALPSQNQTTAPPPQVAGVGNQLDPKSKEFMGIAMGLLEQAKPKQSGSKYLWDLAMQNGILG
jgi:hypothetical protein